MDVSTSPPQARPGSPDAGAADLELVRAALAGVRSVEAQLVDRLTPLPAMIRLKHHRLGGNLDATDLEDVLQSTLLAVWRKLDRYDGRVRLLHWVYGFSVFELLKALERRARLREQEGLPAEPVAGPAPALPDLTERLLRMCRELPELEQEILRLKHFEDRTFEEIAASTGLVVNTVKTRYYRVLARLRQRIGPEEDE